LFALVVSAQVAFAEDPPVQASEEQSPPPRTTHVKDRTAKGQPASARPSQREIQALIQLLGDSDYFVRQKAEQDLAKIGFEAVDDLTGAADSDDMEIVARAAGLLRTIKSNWVQPGDPPGVVQALNDYESQDDANREARLGQLISLPDHLGAAAVGRVICFDRSPVLAKEAAVQLMESLSAEAVKPDLAAAIRDRLNACRRAPARWVLNWLATGQDPRALAAFWSKIIAEEDDQMLRHPRETSEAIIEGVLQLQIAALRRAHLGAEAAGSVLRLMKLHHGDPAALAKLLQWLTDQKDWEATRQVESQFRATIAASPDLLYLVAEAQSLRGNTAAAKRSAADALKLNPDADDQSLQAHYQAGQVLEDRGRHEWAAREWDRVVRAAPSESMIGLFTAHLLGELYHDLQRDDQAAATLARAEKTVASRSNQWKLFGADDSMSVGEFRARRHYFEACHWREQGDRAKQRAALDAAIATRAYDIEVLIECFRVPDAKADYRADIRKLIVKKLRDLREQIGDDGGNTSAAQPCNEFAWLVANTEGDLDEALRYSKRSLELTGNNGSYRDTLARVYLAKGDLDEALKQQAAAAAVLPHNIPVTKQLEVLRAMVEKRKQNLKKETRNPKQIPKPKTE
jgi:tetratricopeptide (TPR) repeat protein